MRPRFASLAACAALFLSACAATHSGADTRLVELATPPISARSPAARPNVEPAAEFVPAAPAPRAKAAESVESIYFTEPALYAQPTLHDRGGRNSLAMFHVGLRDMDDEVAWDDLENPAVFGGEVVLQPQQTGPLGIEFGLQLATDSAEVGAVDVDSTFIELYAGGRLTADFGGVHPYVGAGGTWIYADVTSAVGLLEASDDDGSFGGYAHAGLLFDVGSLVLGLDARVVFGTDVDLVGIDADADYEQLTIFFGTRF